MTWRRARISCDVSNGRPWRCSSPATRSGRLATAFYDELGPLLVRARRAPLVTLHSSLQHEALHGHPTRSAALNEALVFLPLGLLFPYRRFKALHLRHHNDSALTDPYDDPESFYYAIADWHEAAGAGSRRCSTSTTPSSAASPIGPLVMFVGFVGARPAADRRRATARSSRAWVRHMPSGSSSCSPGRSASAAFRSGSTWRRAYLGLVDPEPPHLRRASGARGAGRPHRHRRGVAGFRPALPQQQSPLCAP